MTTEKLAEIMSKADQQMQRAGFTKEWDKAIALRVALEEAGFKIVRKPLQKNL